jgi:hypothetical protein
MSAESIFQHRKALILIKAKICFSIFRWKRLNDTPMFLNTVLVEEACSTGPDLPGVFRSVMVVARVGSRFQE